MRKQLEELCIDRTTLKVFINIKHQNKHSRTVPPPPHGALAPGWPGPPHYRSFTITYTDTPHSDSSGRVISPTQRPLSQHPQQTDMHAPERNSNP